MGSTLTTSCKTQLLRKSLHLLIPLHRELVPTSEFGKGDTNIQAVTGSLTKPHSAAARDTWENASKTLSTALHMQ